MSIEIKYERKGNINIKHCIGDNGICRRDNQMFCDCNVSTGNPELPNRYEGR